MLQGEVTRQLFVKGMTCSGCELKIEKKIKALDGVIKVKANYVKGKVTVTYEENKVNLAQVKQIIIDLDYKVVEGHLREKEVNMVSYPQLAVISIIMLGAFMLINHFGGFNFFNYFPEAKQGMSYAAIFIIGLLTSVHCVGMCGGICLSQCIGVKGESKTQRIRPAFLYNLGRVISYTAIGGIVGALGSIISFNGVMRGAVALLAGVFMIIMGLNMIGIFPWLRAWSVRMPRFFNGNTGESNSPLYIGFINGFMPCGPLQAMQLYALSTGSFLQGAISMFLFSLGTMFLMFGFGAASSLLSKKFTAKLMTISAVLVIFLGLGMFNTGVSMSGFLGFGTEVAGTEDFQPAIVDGYQVVNVEVSPRSYGSVTVLKDIPVKLNLHAEAKNLNGCNNAIIIPEFGIQMPLKEGDNIVEFTATEAGVIPYSCWMNMIKSSIVVVDDVNNYNQAQVKSKFPPLPNSEGDYDTDEAVFGGSCCGGN